MDDQRANRASKRGIATNWEKVATSPCCDGQGDVVAARIKRTGEIIYLCDECDTLWHSIEDIQVSPGTNFTNYVKQFGLKGLWSEIAPVHEK